MAEAVSQWFRPTVRNKLSQTIVLADFSIKYGKFYDINDPDKPEIKSPAGTKIASGNQFEWGHCGREHSPSGTEGTFEIHLDGDGEKIAEIYWDSPWAGSNSLKKNYVKGGYTIDFDGFNDTSGGPLGKGSITVTPS